MKVTDRFSPAAFRMGPWVVPPCADHHAQNRKCQTDMIVRSFLKTYKLALDTLLNTRAWNQ